MKAIVLAGGAGTRLHPLTLTTPKPLIPVHGRTLIEHVFDLVKSMGISEVIISVSYLAEQIQQYLGDGSKWDMAIEYVIETERMGTAGPFILLKRDGRSFDDNFLVLNSDNLFNLSARPWLDFHRSNQSLATLALTRVEDVRQYGVVQLENTKIVRFVEKPQPHEAPSNYINGGYYIFHPELFEYINPQWEFAMLEKDVFPAVAAAGRLHGFIDAGQWFDTGTWERYDQVQKNWMGINT